MKIKEIIVGNASFAAGIALCMLMRQGVVTGPFDLIAQGAEKIGVTFYPLLALALWCLIAGIMKRALQPMTLEYIGTTAQRIGLLGTVIGIVMATMEIGANLSEGAASAVSGALPAVGEALLSTAVGFIIALMCDLIAYLRFSRNIGEIEE
ncbi:MAG: MotA/TolQ/ExbB proton channel family protein [Lentisphaeraceae bacterium]|nr:MotA/TolQ/ExbB proton channel family protein [Lentisphaeraceae bacterium]